MKTPQLILFMGAICAATACGGRTAGVDGSASSSGSNASSGNGSVGGSSNAGNIGGNNANGGDGGAISSAIGLGGTGNTSATGGASPTGGSSSTGGMTATGGTHARIVWFAPCGATAASVCTASRCGRIADECGNVIDCGFVNCPQEICGKDAQNECPTSCSARIDCKSAGNKNCGFISDGCGNLVDCGTCPDDQCCGCGDSASPAGVPNVCVPLDDNGVCIPTSPCGPDTCGPMGAANGCSGVLDCGPCCKPQTCEDICPGGTGGHAAACTSVKDWAYVLPELMPDGCSGVITCYVLPA